MAAVPLVVPVAIALALSMKPLACAPARGVSTPASRSAPRARACSSPSCRTAIASAITTAIGPAALLPIAGVGPAGVGPAGVAAICALICARLCPVPCCRQPAPPSASAGHREASRRRQSALVPLVASPSVAWPTHAVGMAGWRWFRISRWSWYHRCQCAPCTSSATCTGRSNLQLPAGLCCWSRCSMRMKLRAPPNNWPRGANSLGVRRCRRLRTIAWSATAA